VSKKRQKFQLKSTGNSKSFVVDSKTKAVVAVKNTIDAKKLVKRLNSGSGFNGSIPEYMFNGWTNRPTLST